MAQQGIIGAEDDVAHALPLDAMTIVSQPPAGVRASGETTDHRELTEEVDSSRRVGEQEDIIGEPVVQQGAQTNTTRKVTALSDTIRSTEEEEKKVAKLADQLTALRSRRDLIKERIQLQIHQNTITPPKEIEPMILSLMDKYGGGGWRRLSRRASEIFK